MFTGLNNIGSSQDARFPDAVSLDKEEKITKLIGSEWFMIPAEEEVDQAFDIAKTIENSTVRHFMLSDICNAYLKLSTLQGCKKAYKVAQYKEEQIADVRNLLNVIVGVCLRLQTPEALSLAEEIFESYPKQMALSEHKNEFYSAQARLKKIAPKKKYEQKAVDANELNKRVEDLLIKKGDLSTILGRDAKNLVEKRQFQQAIEMANSISDDISRNGILAEIFGKCCAYGDGEALGFAFEIAKNKTQYRDNYMFSLIETCKKLENKELALKFAEEIQDPTLKEKSIRKINLWRV